MDKTLTDGIAADGTAWLHAMAAAVTARRFDRGFDHAAKPARNRDALRSIPVGTMTIRTSSRWIYSSQAAVFVTITAVIIAALLVVIAAQRHSITAMKQASRDRVLQLRRVCSGYRVADQTLRSRVGVRSA